MFSWFDWEKFKREWKTAAVAVVGFLIESYDALIAFGLINLPALKPTFLPEPYRYLFSPALLMLILLLRKWRDAQPREQK